MPLPIESYPTTYNPPTPTLGVLPSYMLPMTQQQMMPHTQNTTPVMGIAPPGHGYPTHAGMEYSYSECTCETCQYYAMQNQYAVAAAATAGVSSTNGASAPYSSSTYSHNPYTTNYGAYPTYANENATATNQPQAMQQMQQAPTQSNVTVGNTMPLQQLPQTMYNNAYNAMGMYNGNAGNMYGNMMMNGNNSFGRTMVGCYPSDMNAINVGCGEDNNGQPVAYSLAEQFNSIVGSIAATACNTRGRSLLQSIMRLQHADKNRVIFQELTADARTVMLDANGCHVVRSLIEVLDDEHVKMLVASMPTELVIEVATTSQYTRRILQALFERPSTAVLEPIVDSLAMASLTVAGTQQGCIALMRVIERCTDAQKDKLLDILCPKLGDLAFDPFGNYVVQSVLEHCKVPRVAEAFRDKLQFLARNKFASNVMEKLFRFSGPAARTEMVRELMSNEEELTSLAADGFGNFVIQAVIDTCTDPSEYRWIAERVRAVLHSSAYGHKIESKLRSKKMGGSNSNISNNARQHNNENMDTRSQRSNSTRE